MSRPAELATESAEAQPLLSVRHLAVDFGSGEDTVHALRSVSFDLKAGRTLALLGESGSGKSVTSLSIMGLLPRRSARVTGGQVIFGGRDLIAAPPDYTRRLRGSEIAMIFQDPLSSLNPVQTVGHQIDEMFRRHQGANRRQARAQTLELMHRVRIPDPRRRVSSYPHEFSGGMRQRVMIATAIALKPRLLIADEPTTALDVTVQAQIVELLTELRDERGMALLFITHDLGVVAPIADEVAVMYAGRVVERGPTRSVYDQPFHPYTAGLLRSLPDMAEGRDRLLPINGNPPDLRSVPPGCAFAPRCPYAIQECRAQVPPLLQFGANRSSACIRVNDIADALRQSVETPEAETHGD
jgi:oligopeptide/dipeptide ABC transporter ATP-binding protein